MADKWLVWMLMFEHKLLGFHCGFLYFFHSKNIQLIIMGKGDKKTKRGKIHRGTYGTRRPRVKKKRSVENKIDIDSKAKIK